MEDRFAEKIILVTGAARGIGLSTVEHFAEEGGTVIATDSDEAELLAAVEKLEDRGLKVTAMKHDVTERRAWDGVVSKVIDLHGRLDVLVNNAGTSDLASIEDISIEQWRRMMSVNLDGVFHGLQCGIAAMREQGGSIINVASIAANIGEPLLAGYCATKGGVRSLTKAAAVDCARRGYGIRINSVHPGFTDTHMVHGFLESLGSEAGKFAKDVVKAIPMSRLAKAGEIAKPILFLASDDASYITGSELIVDGGHTSA